MRAEGAISLSQSPAGLKELTIYMRAEGAISLSQSPAGFNTCGACEKDQQWQQALGLLAVMQKSAILPNVISYNAVVSASEKGHQGPQALSLLAVLQRTAGLPNGISFLAAISAFEKGHAMAAGLGSPCGDAAVCCSPKCHVLLISLVVVIRQTSIFSIISHNRCEHSADLDEVTRSVGLR